MGHDSTERRGVLRATVAALAALTVFLLVFAATANATPFHPREHSLDVEGLNHACGIAVDSKGDFYASSAGEGRINVYNPSHVLLTEIADANTPCGLAVTTAGNLYVSEQATGKVVRFQPSAYPPTGSTTYTETTIDSSGNAKGIAVDRFDNRLYVAEGTKVAIYTADGSFEVNVGEGTLGEASGVAAFTYATFPEGLEKQERYLWVADAAGSDHLDLFRGEEPKALKLRRELTGDNTPDKSFGFGAAGADLAEDPGNRGSKGECLVVGEPQACTSGHLFLYDSEHKALDEFDASGVYLDQTHNAAFADGEPSAIAIDRSGGSNDGTIYVTAGSGSGAKALAFGPLKAPSRKTLKEAKDEAGGLSQTLTGARAVATDSHGDAYVVPEGASAIHIYSPEGTQLTEIPDGSNPKKVAVDSTGKVYVLDVNGGFSEEAEVTYYEPSEYPPKGGTTYTRHEEPVVTYEDFPIVKPSPRHPNPSSIAINPGPGAGKDHLLVAAGKVIYEFGFAAEGSGVLNKELGQCAFGIESIGVDGSSGTVYIGVNNNAEGGLIYEVNATGSECLARFANSGASNGKISGGVDVAVDQSNGHVIEYDQTHGAREYDAAGAFVAEFGSFTEGVAGRGYGVSVDNACAVHEPPLAGSECEAFDPANGTAYVAFDDPNTKEHPPYDLNAFGPLDYTSEPAKHKVTVEKKGNGSGTVTSEPAGIDCGFECSAEFPETEVVRLTAKANIPSESKFEGWAGCEAEEAISPTEGICEVTMNEAREVKAEFKGEEAPSGPTNRRTLTLTKSAGGTGGVGSVTSKPKGINCATACNEAVASMYKNTPVVLKEKPATGSTFVEWTGACSGSAETCTVPMAEAESVGAVFGGVSKAIANPQALTLTKGESSGTGTVKATGLTCEAECTEGTALYQGPTGVAPKNKPGKTVTLKETLSYGSEFSGWTGCESNPTPGECVVTMEEAKEVTAEFSAKPTATLTVDKLGTGTGTVTSKPKAISCATTCTTQDATVPTDEAVILKEKPTLGMTFEGWTGACVDAGEPCTVELSAAGTVTAKFGGSPKAIASPKELTLNKAGSGYGTVKGTGLTCEALCTSTVSLYQGPNVEKAKPGKTVILKALSAPGSKQVGWTGCESNPTPGECSVTMEEAKTVTATFDELE